MTTGNDANSGRGRVRAFQEGTGDNRTGIAGPPADVLADDTENLAVAALTNEADFDKLMATGKLALAPMAALRQMTDWNGMTAKEEEDAARLATSRQQALAEYEREMEQVRERADELMQRLDEQEREIRQKLADLEAKPIVLSNGHEVQKGANGELIDQVTGRTLDGTDKLDAERQQKEKDEEKKKLNSELAENLKAKKAAREAKEVASQDPRNVSAEQLKEQQEKLSEAEGIADKIEAQEVRYEAKGDPSKLESTDTLSALGLSSGQAAASSSALIVQTASNAGVSAAASDLSNTDTLSALGLASPQPTRTASYIGAMEPKDSRAIALKEQFTVNAQGTSVEKAPDAGPALAPVGSTPVAAPAP